MTKRKLYTNFLNNCHGNRDHPVAKLSFFSSDSCSFCFMWMIWKKFSGNTVVFLSIIWCKFQEFKLHSFREIEFFLGGCFLSRTLYTQVFVVYPW